MNFLFQIGKNENSKLTYFQYSQEMKHKTPFLFLWQAYQQFLKENVSGSSCDLTIKQSELDSYQQKTVRNKKVKVSADKHSIKSWQKKAF